MENQLVLGQVTPKAVWYLNAQHNYVGKLRARGTKKNAQEAWTRAFLYKLRTASTEKRDNLINQSFWILRSRKVSFRVNRTAGGVIRGRGSSLKQASLLPNTG